MKKIKIPLLWAIFTAVAFFSCGDVSSPEDDNDIRNIFNNLSEKDTVGRIINFAFLKGKCFIDNNVVAYLHDAYVIDECGASDNIILRCCFDRQSYFGPLIAKVTSYKTGDIKYISFYEEGYIYEMSFPPPPMYYIGRLHLSPTRRTGNGLKVSLGGDILIVEINSNPKITKTLNVRSK